MQERGAQSRRRAEAVRGDGPRPPARGGNGWQVVAIIALVVATAGWTTVAVLLLRPADAAVAQVSPSPSIDASASPAAPSDSPVADSHDAPQLEALLPTELNGTALLVQSWTGDAILSDDGWSTTMTAFLKQAGKATTDLLVAQAYDPTQTLDGSIGVYRIAGIKAAAIRDALIAGWKSDYPDMVAKEMKLGGRTVTKGDFGTNSINSYLFVKGDDVYDIETTDEKIAAAALAALPGSGTTSSAPPASAAPSLSPAPSPS